MCLDWCRRSGWWDNLGARNICSKKISTLDKLKILLDYLSLDHLRSYICARAHTHPYLYIHISPGKSYWLVYVWSTKRTMQYIPIRLLLCCTGRRWICFWNLLDFFVLFRKCLLSVLCSTLVCWWQTIWGISLIAMISVSCCHHISSVW